MYILLVSCSFVVCCFGFCVECCNVFHSQIISKHAIPIYTYLHITCTSIYARTIAPILIVLYLIVGRSSNKQPTILFENESTAVTGRNQYWRGQEVKMNQDSDESKEVDSSTSASLHHKTNEKILEEDTKKISPTGAKLTISEITNSTLSASSRPFNYIGGINPTKPLPWPDSEKDYHKLHEILVQRVKESDELTTREFDINNSRLPQLLFYGDSITEGWGGTSFGNLPSKGRMWNEHEDIEIRKIFDVNFGVSSTWGKRSLKPPLILGISGSRTYDFIWRMRHGEFPSSSLLDHVKGDDEYDTFDLGKLERIYIVLMGTNNLGGGMLPKPTLEGMDAVGRAILQLHQDNFPGVPAAMLFSELLPRRDDFRAEKMCPPRCANITSKTPYKSFMPAINKVNKELPRIVEGWREDFVNSRIVLLSGSTNSTSTEEEEEEDKVSSTKHTIDTAISRYKHNNYTKTVHCGREMFNNMDDIDEYDTYMPDRLHPNAKGYELWSHCIKKGLEVVMDHQISLEDEVEEESR